MRKPRHLKKTLLFIAALVILLILMFPVAWMFQTSILPTREVLSRNPSLLPFSEGFSWDAYVAVFTEKPILQWLVNSAFIAAVAALVSTFAAVLAGYALSRFGFRGKQSTIFVLFVGRVIPGTMLVIPFFVMFRIAGLIDNPASVIIANTAGILPFATLMMRSYFNSVTTDLDDAARVDGCTRLQALRLILLPVASPGIAATVTYAVTASWVDLLFSRTLLINQTNWTIPVGVGSFIGDVTVEWNKLMAVGILSVVPVVVLYAFAQKYLVSGLTGGAVKG